ncbi:MAG TPA: hypothetical protein VGK00_02685 [Anaerolineales bacterium]|jgi:hypothetical protein
MPNKQGKSWREIKIMIAAIGVTATLGFWNLFSIPDKSQVNALAQPANSTPPPPLPSETAEPTDIPLALRPVKIIFSANAPQLEAVQVAAAVVQAPVVQAPSVQAPRKKRRRSSDGGSTSAPAANPSTGSSK